MPRKPCLFRQSDIARAIRGARAGGLSVASVEIAGDGRIVIVAGNGNVAPPATNEWDAT
jgi:hypothetical protein